MKVQDSSLGMRLDFLCCCVHLWTIATDQTTVPSNETTAPANCQEVWTVTGVAAVLVLIVFILMVFVVVVQFTVIWSRR